MKTLSQVASAGLVFVSTTTFGFYKYMQHNISQADYYAQAVDAIQAHERSMTALGNEVKPGHVDLFDGFTKVHPTEAKVSTRRRRRGEREREKKKRECVCVVLCVCCLVLCGECV